MAILHTGSGVIYFRLQNCCTHISQCTPFKLTFAIAPSFARYQPILDLISVATPLRHLTKIKISKSYLKFILHKVVFNSLEIPPRALRQYQRFSAIIS